MFSLSDFKKSINYAWQGLCYVYNTQNNFRLQIFVSFIVIIFAFYFSLSRQEWIMILFLIALVLILEILNTAVEVLTDLFKPKIHHYVKIIKDLMAGAVVIASLLATIVGLLIFIPHLNFY